LSTASKMASATGSGDAIGSLDPLCHIGFHRAGQDRVHPYPLPGRKGAK
jgi:hypothetical protein